MTGFLKDFFTGDFTKSWEDIVSRYNKLPQVERDFIEKVESDAWSLVRSLAAVGIQDVAAGGFTTASFVSAAKDMVAKGAAQGQTIGISEAIIQLNILKSGLDAAATPAPAPTAPVAG